MKSTLICGCTGRSPSGYLLQRRSRANIAFKHNPWLSFIPHLIFDLCKLIELQKEVEAAIRCLEEILIHLQKEYPDNLQQQLKIPIEQYKNSLDSLQSQKPRISLHSRLFSSLLQFEEKEKDVFSWRIGS